MECGSFGAKKVKLQLQQNIEKKKNSTIDGKLAFPSSRNRKSCHQCVRNYTLTHKIQQQLQIDSSLFFKVYIEIIREQKP